MNMIRGASAFLAVLAIIFTFTNINSHAAPRRTNAQQQQQQSPAGSSPITCTDAPPDAQLCGYGAYCDVWLNVSTSTSDNTVTAAEKVWILPTQKIRWRAMENNSTAAPVDIQKVYFTTKETGNKPKKGDKKISRASCQHACTKNASEFTPCVAYAYTAVIPHNGETKIKDPEIEIATTTGPPPPPPHHTSTTGH